MKSAYDGLEIVRIPLSSNDIYTGSHDCFENVMNIMVNRICVSEHEDNDFCTDYEHERYEETFVNVDPAYLDWGMECY